MTRDAGAGPDAPGAMSAHPSSPVDRPPVVDRPPTVHRTEPDVAGTGPVGPGPPAPAEPDLTTAVLASSPLAVAIFDQDGRLLRGNPALARLSGAPLDSLVGGHGAGLLDGEAGVQHASDLADVARTGRSRTATMVTPGRPPAGLPLVLEITYFRLDVRRDAPSGGFPVAALIADVTRDHAARDALRETNERLLMVGRVTSMLGDVLEVESILARIADLVVPTFADHCLVDLATDQGGLDRRINRDAGDPHPGPSPWPAPGTPLSYPADSPMLTAVRTGRGQLLEMDPGRFDYRVLAPGNTSGEPLRELGLRGVVTAPMWARGGVVGLITLGTSGSGRRFTADDLDLVTQLADRAAVALDNAMLFEKQQQFALTLQRSLLPASLPPALGLGAAARYLPAKDGGAVGGDWYDVIPLSAGRIAIVVGDVMGRGVAAAALMGQVRAALRAYAVQDLAPAHVLECADELVRGLDDEAIVTCVYAVFDPRDEQLTFGNAGHVPPLLVRPGSGDVVRIDATGPPLGAGGLLAGLQRDARDALGLGGATVSGPGRRRRTDASSAYTQLTVKVPSDALIAAYTDGLVESREQDADSGIERLGQVLRVLAGAPAYPGGPPGAPEDLDDLENLCDEVLRRMGRTVSADDVALLLIRPDPSTRPRVAALSLDPLAEEVARARAFTVDTLAAWGEDESLEDAATLVVSELVTNAVRHAGSPARLKLSRQRDGLIVEVRDSASAPPRWRRAALDDEGGRGLLLVSLIATEWGARSLPEGGKAVWCRLAAPARTVPVRAADKEPEPRPVRSARVAGSSAPRGDDPA